MYTKNTRIRVMSMFFSYAFFFLSFLLPSIVFYICWKIPLCLLMHVTKDELELFRFTLCINLNIQIYYFVLQHKTPKSK